MDRIGWNLTRKKERGMKEKIGKEMTIKGD